MSELSPKTRTIIVFLLIGIHLAIAVPLAWHLNIWVDEASTLYATQNGFWTTLQTAASEQRQAPLYFWITSLWRMIDGSVFFARLFSIGCSIGAIGLFWAIAKRFLPSGQALVLTAFFALHPFLIWASLEIRVYSMVVLLSLVMIRLFLSAFPRAFEPRATLASRIWFVAAVIISLYTNYYLGFVVAGLFASLVVNRRWRDAFDFVAWMIPAGVAIIPLMLMMRAEFVAKTGGYRDERTLIGGMQALWNNVLTFVLPTEIFTPEDQTTASMVRVWVVRSVAIVIAALAALNWRRISDVTLLFGGIAAGTLGFLMVAYFLIGPLYVEIRHAAVLFAPLTLFLGSLAFEVFAGVSRERARAAATVGLILLTASFTYATLNIYPAFTKRGDWARVGEYIRQNEQPGQPIVVFIAFDALALRYNYSGVNRILPDERYFTYGPEAKLGTEDSLKTQIDFVISKFPPDAEQVWLAVSEKCMATKACIPLQNWVEANYTIETEREFYLEKVYLLRRKHQ